MVFIVILALSSNFEAKHAQKKRFKNYKKVSKKPKFHADLNKVKKF
jgi:hypothetical protein